MAQPTPLSELIPTADCFSTQVFNSTTRITADPDIAGIGVICSFILAQSMALTSCCLYLVLEGLLEPTSFKTLLHLKGKLFARSLLPEDQKAAHLIECLHQWILALSDQQLITGLAVLIAAFARWDKITIYHFEIAASLAFYSAGTHLITLRILSSELRKQKMRLLLYVRVTAMFGLFVLLFVAIIYSGYRYWYEDVAWPMRCVALKLRRNLSKSYGGTPAIWAYVYSVWLIVNYLQAFLQLSQTICTWAERTLAKHHSRITHGLRTCRDKPRAKWTSWDYTALIGWRIREVFLAILEIFCSRRWMLAEVFCWFIVNTWGILSWRLANQEQIDDAKKEADITGFGQLLPLFLLLIPFLTLVETYLQ
ncbi:MAG: hypothetical protein M1814_004257 [Vezdaea aestivalis]|nr:MAG: hypothetical protein M1814_004257 [Vezdaea aestivalis]